MDVSQSSPAPTSQHILSARTAASAIRLVENFAASIMPRENHTRADIGEVQTTRYGADRAIDVVHNELRGIKDGEQLAAYISWISMQTWASIIVTEPDYTLYTTVSVCYEYVRLLASAADMLHIDEAMYELIVHKGDGLRDSIRNAVSVYSMPLTFIRQDGHVTVEPNFLPGVYLQLGYAVSHAAQHSPKRVLSSPDVSPPRTRQELVFDVEEEGDSPLPLDPTTMTDAELVETIKQYEEPWEMRQPRNSLEEDLERFHMKVVRALRAEQDRRRVQSSCLNCGENLINCMC